MIASLLNKIKRVECLFCNKIKTQKFYRNLDDDRLPFIEVEYDDYLIRTFMPTFPEYLFKWHTDNETRELEILNNTDFKFQFDNEMPMSLREGQKIKVPKGTFHRLIKGNIPVSIKITKFIEEPTD